jgi:hypothetical protein
MADTEPDCSVIGYILLSLKGKDTPMSIGLILVIILIIFLLGGFSGRFGGYGYGYVTAASGSSVSS